MKIELSKLIEKMDTLSKKSLEKAGLRCIGRGGNEVLVEDLLYVMLEDPKTLLRVMLAHYNIAYQEMQKVLEHGVRQSTSESANPVFSPLLIGWLEDAYVLAHVKLESNEVDESALIMALFENASKYANTSYFKLLSNIPYDELTTLLDGLREEALEILPTQQKQATPYSEAELGKYTTNLTQLAKEGKIDPVLCRDEEIQQAIDIILRRRKNNPILVGEAGVGKTAVVEGLALKIVNNEVPHQLYDAQILSLDIGALQAGASVKGEFERRLQALIEQIRHSYVSIILFIDEAHTLIGAGGNEGGSDAANILKPALARGELRTIAATTWLEYRKYFEKDPALSRRFQKIDLLEPSVEEAVTILRGIAQKYEEEHDVYIEDEALVAAARLSSRYITGRQLPDKAIDVLDTACANVKISKSNIPYALQNIQSEIAVIDRTLDSYERDQKNGVKEYTKEIRALHKEKKQLSAQAKEIEKRWQEQKKHFEKLVALRQEGKTQELKKELAKLKSLQKKGGYIFEHVGAEQIAKVISSWTGIPLGSMLKEQSKLVLSLQEQLRSEIIGQDEALEQLGTFLQISVAGMKNENAPAGVFLLVGPSGVGKTQTARNVAEVLFGGEQFLTVVNMTEFQEKHTVSRLIGSPPGYVGYGEGGQLTDPVRVKPYSVVLLDEIEKAHPDILNLFYQLFDRGVISDGEGREIDFRNTVIFMTSNLATEEITKLCSYDEHVSIETIVNEITPLLSSYLKPALLGRMNVIPFKNLAESSLKRIVELKLEAVRERLKAKEIELVYEEALLGHLVTLSNALDTGARNIDLVINTNVMPPLSRTILEAATTKKKMRRICIAVNDAGEITISNT